MRFCFFFFFSSRRRHTRYWRDWSSDVCSSDLNVLVRVARGLKLEEKLRQARERLGHDLAVQAEMIGPGIQKNKYALKAVTLRAFNVLNVDAYRLLDHGAMLEVLGGMGLESVPQLGTLVLNHTVDE